MLRLLCIIFLFPIVGTHAQTISITAGNHDRIDVPVSLELSRSPGQGKHYTVVNVKTAHSIRVQVEGRRISFILNEKIPAHSSAIYKMKEVRKAEAYQPQVVNSDSVLSIRIGSKPVLKYYTGVVHPPANLPDYYKRSGFIHPVYSPEGKILTDDFPKGHEHQHGVFQTWVNTTFRGNKVDFWNQHNLTGTVEHAATLSTSTGVAYSKFRMLLHHRSLKDAIILQDTLTVTVYPYKTYFLFDIESHQVNVTRDTLFLNQYHYGGMAFRGNKAWNPDDTLNYKESWSLITGQGKRTDSANHTRAGWVKITGDVEGSSVSATVFDHPENFRYPQFIRVHPTMPYFCFFPMVEQPHYIAPGGHYRSTYRYLIEDGKGNSKLLEKVRIDWVEGLKVEEVK